MVLGHARALQAIPGGKANTARSDAQKMAVWLRGGMLPQAYVSPATLRATRALLRRRMPLMRKRAEWLTPIHNTKAQCGFQGVDNVPWREGRTSCIGPLLRLAPWVILTP